MVGCRHHEADGAIASLTIVPIGQYESSSEPVHLRVDYVEEMYVELDKRYFRPKLKPKSLSILVHA